MTTLADIPTGQRTMLDDFRNQWEALGAYDFLISDDQLIQIWHSRTPNSLADFSQVVWDMGVIPQQYHDSNPWLQFGMNLDQYHSQASTFASEYLKLTGQDIPADELTKAFKSTKDATGGLLTGSEYLQRLQLDQNIQKNYGWVKYGLDFQQFQQQKLQMRESFGRDLTDAEATTQLQYLHAAQGGNHAVTAQTQSDQSRKQPIGITQSEVR